MSTKDTKSTKKISKKESVFHGQNQHCAYHQINNTKFFNTTGRLCKFYKKAVQQAMDVP
jgi:hypothetical protein